MKYRSTVLVAGALLAASATAVFADGTEILGPPSISIASGTGVASAGTGMLAQPATLTVEVPAGANVTQVLLYWEGFQALSEPGDDTITVNGNGVTGLLIGGPTFFFPGAYASAFRADISGLGLVGAGTTSLQLSGLDFTTASNGAGVIVIYDDGSTDAQIALRDGSDLAFANFSGQLQNTVAQTFTFPPSASDRTATINLFFASVSGTLSGGTIRPTTIEITTDGVTTQLNNLLDSVDGGEWDSFAISVLVPAGATSLTVQPFSRDDLNTGFLPASFDWVAAAFSLEAEAPSGLPGRMTGGGSVFTIDGARVTRGFQIHCDLRAPNNLEVNWPGGNRFHLTQLTSAVCTDSPAVAQEPPKAPFDTFTGSGTGLYRGVPGARIEFVFVDAGEPGTSDTASIQVFDATGTLVLDVPGSSTLPGLLDRGNLQAHKDNKSTL